MIRARRPGEAGFTLVEALIALAIIAAMTTVLIDTATGDARGRAAVRARREALMLAQSALAASYDPATPERGSWRGYTWQVTREPAGAADALDSRPLERVGVAVAADGRTVTQLATVRMRP